MLDVFHQRWVDKQIIEKCDVHLYNDKHDISMFLYLLILDIIFKRDVEKQLTGDTNKQPIIYYYDINIIN